MFAAMEAWPLAVWVRESTSIFGYTLVLSLHAMGLAMAVGFGTLISVRLLGGMRSIPLAALHKIVLLSYLAFILNFISGSMLFISEATKMGVMPAFWGKIFFVLLGTTVIWRIDHKIVTNPAVNTLESPPDSGRRLAYFSLACWYLALIVGRLTGYPELVNRMLGL